MTWRAYDKDHMSELRIKSRSERDLRSQLSTLKAIPAVGASDFFLDFICNSASIIFRFERPRSRKSCKSNRTPGVFRDRNHRIN